MATRQPGCYAALSITLAAATLCLICRLCARRLKKLPLSLDDYLAIFAFTSALAYNIASFVWLHLGLGLHLRDVPHSLPEIIRYSSLIQFIIEQGYTFSIAASQLSLLALFWRVFSPISSVRYYIYALTCGTIVWFLIRFFLATFQCIPLRYMWDKSIKGHCWLKTGPFFTGTVSAHMFLDLCLMALPASQIRKLAMKRLQKVGIATMFMFGIIVCISSIMMILEGNRYKTDPRDRLWNGVGPDMWSGVEINLSIVTACIPLTRPTILALSRKIVGLIHPTALRSATKPSINGPPSHIEDVVGLENSRKTSSMRDLLHTEDAGEGFTIGSDHQLQPLTKITHIAKQPK